MQGIPRRNRDLRRYVLRRAILRMLGWLSWIGIWIFGALSYNANHETYPPERRMIGWRLWLLIAVAVVSGFLLFRIGRFLRYLPWSGRVERSRLQRSYSAGNDPGDRAHDFREHLRLRIRTTRGRVRIRRVEQKNGFYQYYYEGTDLVQLFGLPYPIRTVQTPESGYLCVACGRLHAEAVEVCERCGLSLIDTAELGSAERSES